MQWMQRWLRYMGMTMAELKAGKRLKKSESEEEYPGPILNSDVRGNDTIIEDPHPAKAYTNVAVKSEAKEGSDFVLIPHELWIRWEKVYGGVDIKRFTYWVPETKSLFTDVYLQKVTIAVRPTEKWIPFDGQTPLYVGKREAVKELREKVERILARYMNTAVASKYRVRVWKLSEQTVDDIDFLIRKFRSASKEVPIELDGKLLDDSTCIEELNLGADPVLLVEMVNKSAPFLFREPRTIRPRYFEPTGKFSEEEVKEYSQTAGLAFAVIPYRSIVPMGANCGRTGMENLGNTCYMNSGLQCLSNCHELTKYFLIGLYKDEINVDNPLGQKGNLAQAYSDLIEDLWRGSARFVSAAELKRHIVLKADQFRGSAQQDCQELILHLLDGLHEDLNRIRKKPYVEDRDGEGRPDEVLSKEQWETYLGRNRSVVVDLFSGQFRSKIVCPTCSKVSVKFDPFMALSVPIPQIMVVYVLFVYTDISRGAVNIEFTVSECTMVSQLTGKICHALKLPASSKLTYFVAKQNVLGHVDSEHCNVAAVKGGLYVYEYSLEDYNGILDKKQLETEDLYFLQVGVKYAVNGIFSPTLKQFDWPMVTPVPKDATILQVRMMVYARLRSFFKLGPESAVPAQYLARFQSAAPYRPPPYILEIVNNRRTTHKYYFMTEYEVCEFCRDGPHPGNCPLNVSNERKVPFKQLLGEIKDGRELKLCVSIDDTAVEINHSHVPDIFSAAAAIRKFVASPNHFSITLDDCLELFSQEEQLDGDNMWYCGNCKRSVQAMKKLSLYRLPRILIVHLKRFKQKLPSFLSTAARKVTELVDYPTNGLDMGKFVRAESGGENVYDLFAVANHYGGISGGHYTASCYNPVLEKWLTYDDTRVYKAASEEVASSSAYVLFYHRVEPAK